MNTKKILFLAIALSGSLLNGAGADGFSANGDGFTHNNAFFSNEGQYEHNGANYNIIKTDNLYATYNISPEQVFAGAFFGGLGALIVCEGGKALYRWKFPNEETTDLTELNQAIITNAKNQESVKNYALYIAAQELASIKNKLDQCNKSSESPETDCNDLHDQLRKYVRAFQGSDQEDSE